MYTKIPRYILYTIQYKSSATNLIILDICNKRRLLCGSTFHNNRPTKKFTPKLLEKLETYTFTFISSIKYFTIDLQNRFCSDTEVNMSELMSLIKVWEKMISTDTVEKITKLYIIS